MQVINPDRNIKSLTGEKNCFLIISEDLKKQIEAQSRDNIINRLCEGSIYSLGFIHVQNYRNPLFPSHIYQDGSSYRAAPLSLKHTMLFYLSEPLSIMFSLTGKPFSPHLSSELLNSPSK